MELQPAPQPGRIWSLPELMKSGIAFQTMIGTYGSEKGKKLAPSLGNLSVHYWHLQNDADDQTPHKEDELYYVLGGGGAITVSGVRHQLKEGDLVFVPRCVEHRFHDFEQHGLHLLIMFSPDFSG